MTIDIQSISKSFGNKEVLKGIDLSLHAGKVYGIVGENGAGKTTLFRCISGLESYDGNIQSPYEKLKHHLGLLTTHPYFLSRMTGREYLQLMCNARHIYNVDFNAKNIFELPLDEYAEHYSTGMKKKLALLAVLLQQNDVFILDEPYNGVDIQSNIIITEIIHHLKSLGKTIIISSHIFSTLADTCDEIHLLQDGRISRKVEQHEFQHLEEEMKSFTIGNIIQQLNLS